VRIFFDVDDTLITWDVRIRPGVREVFAELRREGHELYLWSGYGPRWEVVERFALAAFVSDCYWKPLYDFRERLAALGIPAPPDFVVDDHPEIVAAFGGFLIPAPREPLHEDRAMWDALTAIRRHAVP